VFGHLEGWETLKTPEFEGKSAAWFASVRSQIKRANCKSLDEAKAVADDFLESDISTDRDYQRLQALLNCTRKSLLPKWRGNKESWRKELKLLEEQMAASQ
jgi:hypothetical protein